MKFFSSKLATDDSFCDRDEERKLLIRSFQQNEHCVITAPRRYGKTSLSIHAIEESGILYSKIDFFCVVYEEEAIRKLAKGVSEIMQQLCSRTEKTLSFLEGIFKFAMLGLKAGGFEINVQFSHQVSPVEHIEDLLQGLERVAAENHQTVVLFMDEFQDILKLEQSSKIQAAIRSVAQHSKYVTYLFSGSSRHLLEKIFDDSNQPLYMMCKKILLGRIEEKYWIAHCQKAAKATWGKPFSKESLEKIFALTDFHTYYMNALGATLIALPMPPTQEDVETAWAEELSQCEPKLIAELEGLSPNQLKVLTNIALLGEVRQPNSRKFIDQIKLPLASIQKVVSYLLENDLIYKTKIDTLKLVDPMMQGFLRIRY